MKCEIYIYVLTLPCQKDCFEGTCFFPFGGLRGLEGWEGGRGVLRWGKVAGNRLGEEVLYGGLRWGNVG